MKWFLLFVVANLLDAGMTHYLIWSGYPVEEVGPVSGPILAAYGWTGLWIFKILMPIGIYAAVDAARTKESRDRIMKVASITLMVVVCYSLGLFAFLKWASLAD